MSVRDVTKQLRTVLSRNSLKDDISSPAAHEPPTELLSIIHACASANSDSISREDQVRLLECLLECATDVADNNSKISMGLVTLAECLQTPIASPSFDQASFLWDVLLRPALAPALSDHSNWTPLTRQASAASKKLALWLLDHEQHQDDVVSLMEKHILQDYCDLAQKAVTSKLSADKSLLALKDILSTAARPRAKNFLTNLAERLPLHASCRAALLDLTGFFLRAQASLAHHAIGSGLLKQLLVCFIVEVDPVIIQSTLTCILIVLPRITVALPHFLPDLMACYAKVAALHHKQRMKERQSANSIEETFLFDIVSDKTSPGDSRLPALAKSMEWVQLRPTMTSVSYEHLPARDYFTYLYGLLPCNLSAFLRHPDQYLQKHEWQSPFAMGLEEPSMDLRLAAANSETFLKMHALQANIIISSAAQEVANLKRRWERFDPSIIIDECQSLYLIHPPPAIGPQRATSSQSLPLSTPMHNSLSELASPASQGQDPPFLSPALHMLPLPNLEVANVRSSPAASSGNSNKTPTDNSNAERLIAFKDREILLLRSELQHELYLKSQHVQQMGTLHRQKVLDSGYEADRQAMMNQVKYYRGQLSERQTQIDKQRAEASTARQAHVKWEGELRGKNRALKDERRAWRLERDGLKAQIETMQAQLAAQTSAVDDLGAENFDLTAELEKTSEKAKKVAEYEESLEKLTTSMLLWDHDIKVQKQQEEQIKQLLSDWRKACDQAEASEAEASDLKAKLQSTTDELDRTRRHVKSVEEKLATSQRPVFQTLRRQDSNDKLRKECSKMRTTINELEERLFALHATGDSEIARGHSETAVAPA